MNVPSDGRTKFDATRAPAIDDLLDSVIDLGLVLEQCGIEVEEGPVPRDGAKGAGVSVYFRDPDGSLLEFISYAS